MEANGVFEECDMDTVDMVIDETTKLAINELYPLNMIAGEHALSTTVWKFARVGPKRQGG